MAKRGTSEEVIVAYFTGESTDKVSVMYNIVRGIVKTHHASLVKRKGSASSKRAKAGKTGANGTKAVASEPIVQALPQ